MANLSPPPKLQFFDANGVPLAGGKLYSYAAGTTTPLATYTSAAETTFNTNPIILNSRGEVEVWLGSPLYKFKLTTAANVEIWTVDNITSLSGIQVAIDASLKAYYAATAGSSRVGFIQAGAGADARTAEAKMRESVSVKDFGAIGNGVAIDGPAIQEAIDSLAATGGSVYVPPGTYLISSPLRPRANVTLWSDLYTATIKQAAGANLTILLDFSTYSANNSAVLGLVIDGNRANNNNDIAVQRHVFWLYDTNYVTIDNCEIKEFNGTAVTGRNCFEPRITNCVIHDNLGYGIGIARTAFANNSPVIANNRFVFNSWHAIGLINCYHPRITGNYFETFKVTGQTVTVSGTTATLVSGPNFSGVRPGNFLIYDNGREALIMSVDSLTQLTLQGAPVAAVAVAAACGAADIVNVQASASTLIEGNQISGGVAGGIVVWADTGQTTASTIIAGNILENIGGSGISLQQYGVGSFVLETSISHNIISDAGLDGAAIPSDYRNAINVVGPNVASTTVIGNTARAYSATMDGLNVITAGVVVRAANNFFQGMAANIVNGTYVTLGAGWGAGTAVSDLLVTEDTISFLVTTSGTASSANPTFELTHRVLPARSKVPSAQMAASSGTILSISTSYPDPASASVFIVNGTPALSTTYRFVVRL